MFSSSSSLQEMPREEGKSSWCETFSHMLLITSLGSGQASQGFVFRNAAGTAALGGCAASPRTPCAQLCPGALRDWDLDQEKKPLSALSPDALIFVLGNVYLSPSLFMLQWILQALISLFHLSVVPVR